MGNALTCSTEGTEFLIGFGVKDMVHDMVPGAGSRLSSELCGRFHFFGAMDCCLGERAAFLG